MSAKVKNKYHNHTNRHTKPRNVSLKAFERTYWPYLPLALLAFLGVAFLSDGALHAVAHKPYAIVIVGAAAILSVV